MRDPSHLDMTGRALQTGYTACTARGKDEDSGQAAWSGAARGGWDDGDGSCCALLWDCAESKRGMRVSGRLLKLAVTCISATMLQI